MSDGHDITAWLRVHGLHLQVIGQSSLHEVHIGESRRAALLSLNVAPVVVEGSPLPEYSVAPVPLHLFLSQAVLEHLAHVLQAQGVRPVDHSAAARQLS